MSQSHRFVDESIHAMNPDLGTHYVSQRLEQGGDTWETYSVVIFPETGKPSFRTRSAFPPDRLTITSIDDPDPEEFWAWVDKFAAGYRDPGPQVGKHLRAEIFLTAPRMGTTLEIASVLRVHYLVDWVSLHSPELFPTGDNGLAWWIHNGIDRTPSPFMLTPLDEDLLWRETWMGELDDLNYPYVDHAQHGLFLVQDYWFRDGAVSAFTYEDISLGVCFTSEALYPYIFDQTREQWLFYQTGSVGPRWFYNFTTEAWESH